MGRLAHTQADGGRLAPQGRLEGGSGRYEHGGDVWSHPGCVDFSASLNPLGMPHAAREALIGSVDAFSCYPDPGSAALIRAISAYEGVPTGWVLACAGATDAFARVCQVLRPRQALVCAPCYSGYEQALEQVGAHVTRHTLRDADDYAVTEGVVSDVTPGTDVVFLASPNNPTGLLLPRDVLVACLGRARDVGATVVLDECFVDLADGRGSVGLLSDWPNLVLVKAFTKTYALAGLRLGYALCADSGLLGRLRAAGQPWAVSVPAQVAGVACLGDAGYLRESRALVARERRHLARALRALGPRVIEGAANYLMFETRDGLARDLLARGVLVRDCGSFGGLEGSWYRVAVRLPEQNALLVATLGEVL